MIKDPWTFVLTDRPDAEGLDLVLEFISRPFEEVLGDLVALYGLNAEPRFTSLLDLWRLYIAARQQLVEDEIRKTHQHKWVPSSMWPIGAAPPTYVLVKRVLCDARTESDALASLESKINAFNVPAPAADRARKALNKCLGVTPEGTEKPE